jgi:hypothetical protein
MKANGIRPMLKFSFGNSKLANDTLIFSLPAGKTCPGASLCLAFANEVNGKRILVNGPNMEFRCFAACSEAQYPNVYDSRQHNWDTIKKLIKTFGVGKAGKMVADQIQSIRKKSTKLVRIHESGDFYSADYFAMWMHVCRLIPDLKFYAYSKNLTMILDYGMEMLPKNFYLTASKGGKFDYLIDEGFFPRYSVVVKNEAEAEAMGLEVDHDDSHCYKQDGPFALLVHGNQPAGSEWREAIKERKNNNQFVGYNKKVTV